MEQSIKSPTLSCAECTHARQNPMHAGDVRFLTCANTRLVGFHPVTGEVNATHCGRMRYINKCMPEHDHEPRLVYPTSVERVLAGRFVAQLESTKRG